jgi:hypothetical protein
LRAGVKGIWPDVTSSPEPTIRTTWARTRSTVMSRDSRTRAARPLLAEQAEEDVLRADVVVLERPRLLLGEDDHLSGSLCESLEHVGGDPSC